MENNKKVYGYVRISTKKQSIDRQIRNILEYNSEAIIKQEIYTGTKIDGRKVFNELISKVKSGDTIIFDSVSRMSRNADDGFKLYEELYNRNIELVFLKEPHISTTTYKYSLKNMINIQLEGQAINKLISGINEFIKELAKEQIKITFEQSEKELRDLQERTKEGIETARLKGKQIGRVEGIKLITKKSIKSKEQILKYSKYFGGTLSDVQVIRILNISKATYYKYKKQLEEEVRK